MTESTNNPPVNKVRFGSVEVSEWENEDKEGRTYPSFTLRRSYRNQDGEWRDQKLSLSRSDLLRVAAALDKAHAESYRTEEQGDNEDAA